ncbi:hypothetical protein E2C01_011342 [Portunus trituberculatus]|uniref:Uncharacterized protein n=1 Tax=Portunus trituberculatus TaxID=210409 RepID=A0A5B7DBG2_PORTR|nr:hypothetical protein [Portunus trituberculatus]
MLGSALPRLRTPATTLPQYKRGAVWYSCFVAVATVTIAAGAVKATPGILNPSNPMRGDDVSEKFRGRGTSFSLINEVRQALGRLPLLLDQQQAVTLVDGVEVKGAFSEVKDTP